MKKTLIILTVLIALGMIGGGLYTTLANLDTVEEEVEVEEYALMNAFPYEMPDIVMYPAPGYLLF
jgi:hypothetical protein